MNEFQKMQEYAKMQALVDERVKSGSGIAYSLAGGIMKSDVTAASEQQTLTDILRSIHQRCESLEVLMIRLENHRDKILLPSNGLNRLGAKESEKCDPMSQNLQSLISMAYQRLADLDGRFCGVLNQLESRV